MKSKERGGGDRQRRFNTNTIQQLSVGQPPTVAEWGSWRHLPSSFSFFHFFFFFFLVDEVSTCAHRSARGRAGQAVGQINLSFIKWNQIKCQIFFPSCVCVVCVEGGGGVGRQQASIVPSQNVFFCFLFFQFRISQVNFKVRGGCTASVAIQIFQFFFGFQCGWRNLSKKSWAARGRRM
jgi:hypothetical protein